VTARVSWISLTAVKALALEHVDEVDLLEEGLRGDRRFFLVDENDRLVNNKDRRRGPLQLVHADYDAEGNELTLGLPDGSVVAGEVSLGREVATTFHRLPLPARRVEGPWDEALSEVASEPVRLVAPPHGGADRGRSGAATFLGQTSLETIARELGVSTVDPRRFRMNFGLEGLEPHEEDSWIGRRVRVGDAVVVVQGNVGRCAITTQSPETGLPDLDTLKALAAYRGEVPTTEPLPFGVHATVVEPGRVAVGDPAEPAS
jgi:uncharacterized protein YcbX